MRFPPLHAWDLSPREAMVLQEELRPRVESGDRLGPVRLVAAVDLGYEEGKQITRAAVDGRLPPARDHPPRPPVASE